MLFSVIIPTHNRAALLGKALNSIFAQTFSDYEVVVVDDGSTDGTREWLTTVSSRVRVLMQENCGPGAARNVGAKHARGEYLAFLDSDDLWFPWTLATYAKCIALNPHSNLLGGCAIHFESESDLPQTSEPLEQRPYECLFAAMPGEEVWLPTPAVAFRRDKFLELGGFSKLLVGEDIDLWLRAGCLPGFVRIITPFLCAERRHTARITRKLGPTLTGINHILDEELNGSYPGGKRFQHVRAARLARAARSISIGCLNDRRIGAAWMLYWKTLPMNFQLGRWRYIVGFPARAFYHCAVNLLRRKPPHQ